MIDIMCLKYGDLYSHKHVNILYDRLLANFTESFNFTCLTDNSEGLNSNIKIISIEPEGLQTFNKIKVYNPAILNPNKTLYFDLDVIIQDNVDFLLDHILYGGVTTIPVTWAKTMTNCKLPYGHNVFMQGNSSIVGFYGDDPEVHKIYNEFLEDKEYILKNFIGGDDIYLMNYMHEINMFPPGYVYSYRDGAYTNVLQYNFQGQLFDTLNNTYVDDQTNTFRPNFPICLMSHVEDKNLMFHIYQKYLKLNIFLQL